MSTLVSPNIAAHLPALARRQPHTLAVVFPAGRDRQGRVRYTHYTYRQLDDASDRLARGLESVGIHRGMRTVLMVKPSLDFFALTFALFKVGAVPVFVDPGMGIKNLGQCLTDAEPEAFIGIPQAQAARVVLGWGRRTLRHIVTVGRRWFWGGLTLGQVERAGRSEAPYALTEPGVDEPAAILFTSGSTGAPKGAVYTHGIFNAQVEMLRRTYHIESGEIDLSTFPLFALFAPALGMTAIIPDMDFTRPAQVDPRKIVEAIDDFGVTSMFGSPALLRQVGAHGMTPPVKSWWHALSLRRACRACTGRTPFEDSGRATQVPIKLSSLKRVISAGAPVSADILERFAGLLAPGVAIHTPYGATEALPVCSIDSDTILGETRQQTAAGAGVCVGRPIAPMRVAIIKITDEPIATWSEELLQPTGVIGEIVVQGPIVTREYYHRPEATARAKIAAPASDGFYHRMGDLGYRDEQGRIWFCGRKSQRVITATATLFTIPCEAVFNTHPQVFRTALVGVGSNGAVRPVLCVELKEGTRPNRDLERELLDLGKTQPHTRVIETILFHPSFPVDIRHNAKIFREKLAVWAEEEVKRKK